jgi:hypothetical protein
MKRLMIFMLILCPLTAAGCVLEELCRPALPIGELSSPFQSEAEIQWQGRSLQADIRRGPEQLELTIRSEGLESPLICQIDDQQVRIRCGTLETVQPRDWILSDAPALQIAEALENAASADNGVSRQKDTLIVEGNISDGSYRLILAQEDKKILQLEILTQGLTVRFWDFRYA